MKANDSGQLTTDEIPMTKQFPSPNDEGKACELAGTFWAFVLRPSFDIRRSDFVIFRSYDSNVECGVKQLTTDH